MSLMKRAAAALLATTALAAVATTSFAQDFKPKQAGDILVRGRFVAVMPQETGDITSDALGTIGKANVGNAYIPEIDVTYFFTDNFAAELIAGTSRHSVSASVPGLGDVGVGSVWLLPPTLTFQYHPLPASRVSPYVGAGVNWTLFYNASSDNTTISALGGGITKTSYSNAFGWALQAGVDVAITGNWSFNFDVKKIFLQTNVTADTNTAAGALHTKAHIDPWLVGFGIGYRF